MTAAAAVGENSAMRCECLTEFSRLPELAPDWQRLTSQDPQAEVFHLWGWASAFVKAYRGSVSPFVFVVRREEMIVGILPLVRRGNRLEFLGAPNSDYSDLLCEERDAAAVLEVALDALLRLQADWEYGVLDKLPSHSRIVRCWRQLPPRQRKHLQLIFLCPCPTVILNEDREAMLKKLTGRRDLRRHQTELQKHGRLTFRHLETREEAREHLRRLFDLDIARYACGGIDSKFLQAEQRSFFEALIEELDPRTQLRFAVLEVDNQPVAYHIGFRQNGKHTAYKQTFDIDHWDSGPGDVMLKHLFQYSVESGESEFDFTVGDEPYKYRFANRINKNYTLYIERHPARATALFRSLERRARQAARENPALKSALKRAARRLADVRSLASGLVRGGGLPRRVGNAVRALFRDAIWTRAEALFFSSTPGALQEAPDDVPVAQGSLSVLARISLEHPESLNESVLREYRVRLRRGDRVFVARGADGETSILWVGRNAEISVPELGSRCTLRLPEPVFVIYDVWTSSGPASQGVRPEVLRGLARQFAGMELWTCCLSDRTVAGRAAVDAGFELRQRMDCRAWLPWFHRGSVGPQVEAIGSGRETAAE